MTDTTTPKGEAARLSDDLTARIWAAVEADDRQVGFERVKHMLEAAGLPYLVATAREVEADMVRAEKAEAERDAAGRRAGRAEAEALVAELEVKLARYNFLWTDHDWERMHEFSLAHGGEGGDNIITVTLDAAARAEAERDYYKSRDERIANLLNTPDGGQYINDTLARAEGLLMERNELRRQVESKTSYIRALTRERKARLESASDVINAVEEVINRLDGGEASLEDVVYETLVAVDWWSLKERVEGGES